jgi:hypothetical protein
VEAPVAHQWGVTGPAPRPGEEILDGPLQHLVGRESNGVRHATLLQCLVDRGERKGCVGANDALGTLPGRSLAARQSPSWLKTKRGW